MGWRLLIGNCSAIFAPLRQLFRFDSEGMVKVGLALSSKKAFAYANLGEGIHATSVNPKLVFVRVGAVIQIAN